MTTWTCIGLFRSDQLDELDLGLQARGFQAADHSGTSTVKTGDREAHGELHRHGNYQLIVHRTRSGKGTANFYWPAEDIWDFPYDEDLGDRYARVKIGSDTVVVFPSHSWHQFDTDTQQARVSVFTHYSSPESL